MVDNEFFKKIAEIQKYVYENIKEVVDCPTLARKFNLNLRTFRDQFFIITGLTPKKYINEARLNILVKILIKEKINKHRKLINYAHDIGLNSVASFCLLIKRETGKKAMEFIIHIKRKNKGNKKV
ncbi:hypothetical protein AMJ80_02665 [bacterium SM23_31]|nr:MAG: hypothetical protein AMJ80_02665 [bacterium SM23_31]